MLTDFYDIRFNPFDKNCVKEKDAFLSEDHRQMVQRLEYLTSVGSIGVFTAAPGMGKTYALRCFFSSLSPNLNKTAYIPLTTVSVTEFYGLMCEALGIERGFRRSVMFNALRDHIYSLYKEKRKPLVLAIDEAQYLHPSILYDLKMLLNYECDSRSCCSVILLGENYLNSILQKPVHEALRQRISVHYTFQGLSEEETNQYLAHKLETAGGTAAILEPAAVTSVRSISQGNPRKIDILMTHALTIGSQLEKRTIDTEVIRIASDNLALK